MNTLTNDDILEQYKQIKLFNENLDSIKYIKNYLDYNLTGDKANTFNLLFNRGNESDMIILDLGFFKIDSTEYYVMIFKDEKGRNVVEFGTYNSDQVKKKLIILAEEIPNKDKNEKLEELNKEFSYNTNTLSTTNEFKVIEVMNVISSYVRDKFNELNLNELFIFTDSQRARIYSKIINKILDSTEELKRYGLTSTVSKTTYNIKVHKGKVDIILPLIEISISRTKGNHSVVESYQDQLVIDIVEGSNQSKDYSDKAKELLDLIGNKDKE